MVTYSVWGLWGNYPQMNYQNRNTETRAKHEVSPLTVLGRGIIRDNSEIRPRLASAHRPMPAQNSVHRAGLTLRSPARSDAPGLCRQAHKNARKKDPRRSASPPKPPPGPPWAYPASDKETGSEGSPPPQHCARVDRPQRCAGCFRFCNPPGRFTRRSRPQSLQLCALSRT